LSEENAREIVKLLVKKGTKDDGFVQNAAVRAWATEAGMDDILIDGLVSAGNADWITDGPIPGTIKLTPEGFAVGNA